MKKFLSILLAVMMVLSTVSFAAPSLAGTADSAVETPVISSEVAVEETATLAADISEDTSTYGELLFELNFDSLTTLDSQTIPFTSAGTITEKAHSYLTELGNIAFSAYPTYAVKERAAGDMYLELSGGTGYAVVTLNTGSEHSFYDEGGVYTLTADVYRPDAMPITTRFSGPSAEDTPIQDFTALSDSGWGSMILQHDPSCFGNGGHATPFTSTADVRTVKFHRNGGTDEKTVGYDNIRLYWKPLTVDVTITSGSKSVVKTVSTTEAVTVASLSDALGLGVLYTATGAKIGDTTYASTDSIVFAADTTVEITTEKISDEYVHPTHGLMLYDIDFELSSAGTEIPTSNSNFRVGDYATPIAHKVMSHEPSNWHLNSSGFTLNVMADPTDANNLVAGITGATSTGYPALMLNTYSNSAAARYGFIEDNNIVLTIEYDYYDTTADGIALRFGGRSSVSENEGYTKWTTVEDQCVESNSGKVASAWYKNTGVYSAANASRMGGTDEISFVKMHAASPTSADLYWDNVRLYYRPATVDLTISANGVSDVTIATPTLTDAQTSYTVSELLTAAGVDYSEVSELSYVFKGVSLDAEGTTVYGLNDTISFYEDSTVYLIFDKVDMSEWTDENGILLYEVDFDDLADGTQIKQSAKISTFGRVNPYIAGSENWYLNLSGYGTVSVGDYGVVEGGVLKLIKIADGQYSQVQFSNESGGNVMITDGTIYKEADMKVVSEVSGIKLGLTGYARKYDSSLGYWTGTPSNQNSVQTISNVTSGTWYTLSGSKTLEGTEYNSESCTIYLPTYPATGGVGDEFYIDNLRLYWKPATVNVTIVGGQNADFETVTIEDVSTAITLDELMKLIPGATSDFGMITGLADENGTKLSAFGAVSDVTYQALWSPWNKIEGAGQEFAINGECYSNKTQFGVSGFGTTDTIGSGGTVTKAYITMYRGTGSNNDGYGVYTADNNLIWKQLTPTAGDSNLHGSTTYTDDYTVAAIPQGSGHRVTMNLNLPTNNSAKYILVKYKFQNVPDLTSDFAVSLGAVATEDGKSATYTTRSGGTATYSNLVDYTGKYYVTNQAGSYYYGGGLEYEAGQKAASAGDGVTVDLEAYNDKWIYDLIPVDATLNTDGVKAIMIDRPNHFRDMITVWDYVWVVGDSTELDPIVPEQPTPEYAPTTDTEKASIRIDAPSGIRFRATITSDINTVASDYGWVVARQVKLTDVETELVVGGANTIVGYGRQDGTDLKSFFDETDGVKTFTAVVYNLPAGYETDVLVSKPFVKVDGTYYYGATVAKSIYEVACAIRDGGYEGLSTYQITKIDAIIAAVDA